MSKITLKVLNPQQTHTIAYVCPRNITSPQQAAEIVRGIYEITGELEGDAFLCIGIKTFKEINPSAN